MRALTELIASLADPSQVFAEVSFDTDVARAMRLVAREDVSVLTRDGSIRSAAIQSIW